MVTPSGVAFFIKTRAKKWGFFTLYNEETNNGD
jgi:hypothetical protein